MYQQSNTFRDGTSSSSMDRSYGARDRLSSTTSCSSMSSRSGGAPGWGQSRNGGFVQASHQRNATQHRPVSPSYQRRTSNLSLSSSGSHQGSPGPSSAMSIPTSGIGSDRYSTTSRELDSSDRRSLHSSPKHVPKGRQNEEYQTRHYSNSYIHQQRPSDRNCNRGDRSSNPLQGANSRSSLMGNNHNSAKQMPPSNLKSSPNFRTSSGNVSTSSNILDRNPSILISKHTTGHSTNSSHDLQSSKFSSNSHQSLTKEPSPRSVRISVPPTISTSSTVSSMSRQHPNAQQSRWQKLFSSFKKSKNGATSNSSSNNHGSGPAHAEDAFSLKHSHNCSNSFLKAGISNMKGYKKANQDRCTAFSYLEGDPELAYFAVYDGHGGTGVANYLKDHLHEFILDQPEYKKGNMEEAVYKAFLKVDGELRTYGSATELTGSTATVIMIKHGDLLCANLGDSRAVANVLGSVKNLSQDHNTSNSKERERVYSMGGTIKDNRVGGVLIPTRSFGDFLLKSEQDKPAWKQVISVVPQLQFFKLDPNWEFVVVGSDGVWDAMSSQEMSNYIKSRLSPYHNLHGKDRDKVVLSELCEQILDHCCAKTVNHYGKNSCDNMTIIIIWFDHSEPGSARSETGGSIKSSSGVSSASR